MFQITRGLPSVQQMVNYNVSMTSGLFRRWLLCGEALRGCTLSNDIYIIKQSPARSTSSIPQALARWLPSQWRWVYFDDMGGDGLLALSLGHGNPMITVFNEVGVTHLD
jgi:hypothetical protein